MRSVLHLSRSPFLRHLRESNGFFCRLAFACRQAQGTQLVRWLGERRAGKIGPRRPDGLGMVRSSGGLVAFYLELDRGTEDSSHLEGKLIWYSRYDFDNAPHAILFCFHSERRYMPDSERELRGQAYRIPSGVEPAETEDEAAPCPCCAPGRARSSRRKSQPRANVHDEG